MRSGCGNFSELKKVFEILHGPSGCPWDRKQTYATMVPHLKEEVGEFIEAVGKRNIRHMREELGDILLHVMFYSQIAAKRNDFTVEDVIEGLIRKLKRRHPHVFGDVKAASTREVIANWRRIKAQEKAGKHART